MRVATGSAGFWKERCCDGTLLDAVAPALLHVVAGSRCGAHAKGEFGKRLRLRYEWHGEARYSFTKSPETRSKGEQEKVWVDY